MQKQLRLLDNELQLNHMIRIGDSISKPANSFFRALSLSLFSNISQTQFVQSIMRLTLHTNCDAYQQNSLIKKKKKQQNPFPLISQNSQLIRKFINDKQMLEKYWTSPDLQCFLNDNYQLASYTFNRRVSIFYLNKQGYLNQTIISSCRNKTGKKIILAKVGKRFFAVQKQTTNIMSHFIKQNILENIVTNIFTQNELKQKNHNGNNRLFEFDEIITTSNKKFNKIHKKSLSECGDMINKLQEFRKQYDQQIDNDFSTTIKNKYDSNQKRSQQNSPKSTKKQNFLFEQLQLYNKKQIDQITGQNNIIKNYQMEIKQISQKNQINKDKQLTNFKQIDQKSIGKQQQSNNEKIVGGQVIDYEQEVKVNIYQSVQQQQYGVYGNYMMASQLYYGNEYSNYDYMQQIHIPIMYGNQYYSYYDQHINNSYSQQIQQQLIQNNRYRGRLKFFDANGKYGFIIVDNIGIDIFVHYDDLSKAGINKQHLSAHSHGRQLRFQFTYYQYDGKNKKAKKAIDLLLLTQN